MFLIADVKQLQGGKLAHVTAESSALHSWNMQKYVLVNDGHIWCELVDALNVLTIKNWKQ